MKAKSEFRPVEESRRLLCQAGSAAVRSSCWPPVVSAAAGGLAPVGFKHSCLYSHLENSTPVGVSVCVAACRGRVRKHQECSAMAPVRRPKKCPHGRQRHLCRECGGVSICEHGRQRTLCRDCGGASICEHGRRRERCRDCGGSSVCERGRRRHQCCDCGGTSVCEHGRLRYQCRECGGAAVCAHGRRRAHCRDCTNFVCQIEGCPWQDLPFAGASSLLKHMRTMHCDNPRAVTKSKEPEAHQALRDARITFECQRYLPFRGCGLESETAHAFADFALPVP